MTEALPPTQEQFWRTSDPVLDEDGRVRIGGMFPHQRAWWELSNFARILCAGLGAGKTSLGCKRIIALALLNAPVPCAVVSPTFPIARRTVIPTIIELLTGKESLFAPTEFSWRYHRSHHEFYVEHNDRSGTILVLSGEEPDSLRGPNLGAVFIDEPFIQSIEVWKQMVARVRHPLAARKEISLCGCVRRDTVVLPRSGMIPISQFDPGTDAKEYAPIKTDFYGLWGEFDKATQFFNNGLSSTIKVSVTNGYHIETTPDHPLLVMGVNGSIGWKRAGRLRLGDYVAIGRGMEVWGDEDPFEGLAERLQSRRTYKTRNPLPGPLRMDEDWAYFLGYWLAEGSCEDRRLTICYGDDEISPSMFRAVDGLIRAASGPGRARWNSVELIELARYVDLPLCVQPERYLPAWVGRGRREWAVAFLSGLYDGDGCVHATRKDVALASSSERLIDSVQLLLLNFGIVSHKTRVENGPSVRVQRDTVGFSLHTLGNDACALASLLRFRLRRKADLAASYQRSREGGTDSVPCQKQLILRAWGSRRKRLWRRLPDAPQAAVILTGARIPGRYAYNRLRQFIAAWDANEGMENEDVETLRQNASDWYFWAKVTRLEESEAETCDFVIPRTHSFWSNGFISHNTPESINWGYDLIKGELRQKNDVGVIQASSRDNPVTGKDYVKHLEGVFGEREALAYIEGELISLSTGLVYYGASEKNFIELEMPEGAELGCGMDFNVNPMAMTVFWRWREHVHFIKEYELPNADTEFACSTLRQDFGDKLRTVYPDATGSARKTSSPAGKTDFHYIREAGYQIDAAHENPKRKDSYTAVNAKLAPASKAPPTLTIDPKRCPKLVKYISTLSHEDMNTEEQKRMAHLSDAFRYGISRLFPVVIGAQVGRLGGV